MTISKDGRPIQSLEDWLELAPPKSAKHWAANRSAMEAARRWLGLASPQLPPEVTAILASQSHFGPVAGWHAEPEARLPFDQFPGEPRNADLVVHARDQAGDFLLAVEAKADETFGETIGGALAAAMERRLANPRSNGMARVEQLATALLGPRQKNDPSLTKIRYQLLTATAGALRAGELRSVSRVVVLIHEFMTVKTTDEKHAVNAVDLDRFLARLTHGAVIKASPGVLYGPFSVPGAPLFTQPPPALFIGKAVCSLRV